LRTYFPAVPPEGWHDSDEDSFEYVGDRGVSSAAALREASRAIVKSDEKLRWLFGESVGTALSRVPPTQPANNIRLRHQASQSDGSLPLRYKATEDDGIDFIHVSMPANPTTVNRHLSVSSSSTSHGYHRTTYSIDETSSLRRVTSAESTVPLVPRPVDRHDPPSPMPPFAGLVQRREEVLPPSVPPTSNVLTPAAKRDLVKRSRKLQAILGATLDENSAERALRPYGDRDLPRTSSVRFDHTESMTRRAGRAQRTLSYPPPASPRSSLSPRDPFLEEEEEESGTDMRKSKSMPGSDVVSAAFLTAQAKVREERRRKVCALLLF
jgi:hypothetical protein